MNKQRKVLITITYNEMGIIIDTKTEELGSSAQLGTDLAEVGTDTISRQAAIDALTKDKEALEHSINGMSGYEKEFDRFVGQRNQVDCDIYAIEQLPPAQPEPCEDAVSREEVLNCLEWQYPDKLPRTKIMELPPVTPKQRTGKWIDGHCSECGTHAPYWAMASTYHRSNFCPNCGAKMGRR